MDWKQARAIGLKHLEGNNLGHVTLNQARERLHNGMMSQDTYDIFYDVWATFEPRLSLRDYQVAAARQRLVARFS